MLTTFDGAAKTTQTWKAVNDPVMGGVSTGQFAVAHNLGEWTGEVKVVVSPSPWAALPCCGSCRPMLRRAAPWLRLRPRRPLGSPLPV